MRVKMNETKKVWRMKVVSEFLSSPFCPVAADLAAGSSAGESTSLTFGEIDSLESKLLRAFSEKQFLFAGDCIFIEPVRRRGKSGSITRWQRIENSYKGLQKADEIKLVSYFKNCAKKKLNKRNQKHK